MNSGRHASSWHEAVEHADFDLYEADTDDDRWAGGYSSLSTSIGVSGLVDDHIVRVETWSIDPELADDVLRDVATHILGLRHRAENGGEQPSDAPQIETDVRVVTVAEATYGCEGRRLVGATNLWVGHICIADVHVQISTTSTAEEIGLRICIDADTLTRTPPRRRS